MSQLACTMLSLLYSRLRWVFFSYEFKKLKKKKCRQVLLVLLWEPVWIFLSILAALGTHPVYEAFYRSICNRPWGKQISNRSAPP